VYLQRKKKQNLVVNNHGNVEASHDGDIDRVRKKAVKKLRAKLNVSMHSIILSD